MATLTSMQLVLVLKTVSCPIHLHPTPSVHVRENSDSWKCMADGKSLKAAFLEDGFHYISSESSVFLSARKEGEEDEAAAAASPH